MYKLFRPLLFLLSPETAHKVVFTGLKMFAPLLNKLKTRDSKKLGRVLFGLHFSNPIGLAAGLDKNAVAFRELGFLGFGFTEIGTVTPRPQPGNPKPRLFRLRRDKALINRMGFNNHGAEAIAGRLSGGNRQGLIVGGNIGKNKDTPPEKAIDDYKDCFQALFDHVDFFVVNVSSPNTPGLRDFQDKEPLLKLLSALQQLNRQRAAQKPILVKIAPDLDNRHLDEIIEIVKETGISGVIAVNTTVSRTGLTYSETEIRKIGPGGLSGKPLTSRSTEVIRYLKEKSKNGFPVIASGGIMSAEDAMEKFRAGADLIELYTGFIYEGPDLIRKIKEKLLAEQ
jgi:dihydroorotate dehydrogenase